MKAVRHVNARDNLLHIETEGGIVNIRTGLTDVNGRQVTSVEIVPDEFVGEEWTIDGPRNVRLVEGKHPEFEAQGRFVDIVFDGPPEHVSGRFVETEDERGSSIRLGQWVQRPDGYWALRVPRDDGDPEIVKRAALSFLHGEDPEGLDLGELADALGVPHDEVEALG